MDEAEFLRPRKVTQYKKPRRINVVSIALFLLLGAFGYFVYQSWPAFKIRLDAKNEMGEVMVALYRANLQNSNKEVERVKKDLMQRLRKVGVKDPNLELRIERNKKIVAIEAHFTVVVAYPVVDKTYPFRFAPRSETDAARVDW